MRFCAVAGGLLYSSDKEKIRAVRSAPLGGAAAASPDGAEARCKV